MSRSLFLRKHPKLSDGCHRGETRISRCLTYYYTYRNPTRFVFPKSYEASGSTLFWLSKFAKRPHYDIPVLARILGWKTMYKNQRCDTRLISSARCPHYRDWRWWRCSHEFRSVSLMRHKKENRCRRDHKADAKRITRIR